MWGPMCHRCCSFFVMHFVCQIGVEPFASNQVVGVVPVDGVQPQVRAGHNRAVAVHRQGGFWGTWSWPRSQGGGEIRNLTNEDP